MIDLMKLENEIAKKIFHNCYVICSSDEEIIKNKVDDIVKKTINPDFKDFNYIKLDGEKIAESDIISNCETLPFMDNKKIVLVYRANFLSDSGSKSNKDIFNKTMKYIKDVPPYCILIFYYLLEKEREKINYKLVKYENEITLVKIDKYKGVVLQNKIKHLFEAEGKNIGKVELSVFASKVENDMLTINNEIDKLINYTEGREITKQDILELIPDKNDEDIFDLVDAMSKRKIDAALDILNELIYKGVKPSIILRMIERQYNLLINIKLMVDKGLDSYAISKQLKLNKFICDKMIRESRNYKLESLEKALNHCLDTERNLKTKRSDDKTFLELMIVEIYMIK
ncbi:MAG: DNA polymerase III subunit delta [Clostridiaceae bacterium]